MGKRGAEKTCKTYPENRRGLLPEGAREHSSEGADTSSTASAAPNHAPIENQSLLPVGQAGSFEDESGASLRRSEQTIKASLGVIERAVAAMAGTGNQAAIDGDQDRSVEASEEAIARLVAAGG